jgi:pimeloyl-ACP methyl ester carboxylesterase
MEPFRIDVPQGDLDDLYRRIDQFRWPAELPGVRWDYGVPGDYVRELAEYWRRSYDWRAVEARLNEHPQFITEIDGQRIHFLHVRSRRPDALPLILTHGWPGSVAEFLDVIGPLSEDFHLVVPSLPGFGFSGPTTTRGWNVPRIARAWVELMRRLGYDRYGAAGNDWGSAVAPAMGRVAPESVVGVHVTQLWADPSGEPGELDDPTEDEKRVLAGLEWFSENMDAYQSVQRQQPQSLAYALNDSPVGLLGWHCLIYRGGVDADYILTNVMIHWLTGTVASAMRLYREDTLTPRNTTPTTVPIAAAQFAQDYEPIDRLVPREHTNIVWRHTYDQPGHFAAHQSPDLLVADIREFFTGLNPGASAAR